MGAPGGWQPWWALCGELPGVRGALAGKRGGCARQSRARGGQACPTSRPSCPRVLKGLCHKHLIRLYQGMETRTGFPPAHGAGPLGEHPGAGAGPGALFPGPGRALVLPAALHSGLPAQQGHRPPVGEHRGTGSPLWQLGAELTETVRALQGPGHAAWRIVPPSPGNGGPPGRPSLPPHRKGGTLTYPPSTQPPAPQLPVQALLLPKEPPAPHLPTAPSLAPDLPIPTAAICPCLPPTCAASSPAGT